MSPSRHSPKGSARREQILKVAFEVIAREGARGATLGAISRELDMETPHILHYFGSREDLLKEVIQRWDSEAAAELPDDLDHLQLFARAIRRNLTIRGIVHFYLSFATEAVDATHPSHGYFRDRFEQVFDSLTEAISAGQNSGVLRTDLEPRLLARMVVALADGLQLQALLDSDVDAPADLDAAIASLYITGKPEPIVVPGGAEHARAGR